MAEVRSPDRTVRRRPGNPVHAERDARVFCRIDRLARLIVAFVPPAVAVGVDDQRRPGLRFGLIAGLPKHPRVDPADYGEIVLQIVAEPQRIVGVLGKIQMMRPEAGVDESELLGLRIVDGYLPRILHETVGGFVERIELCGTQRRILLAIRRRISWGTLLGGE